MIVCNKEKFDKKSALTALNHCRKENKKYRKECRVYKCPNKWCNGAFHLTSKEETEKPIQLTINDLKLKEEWLKLM